VENEADRIAADIVALVERTGGPVTFTDIERNVRGFHTNEFPKSTLCLTTGVEPKLIWGEMSKPGAHALQKVLNEELVAIQYVGVTPYYPEAPYLNWLPAVLLPTNIETPRGITRSSPEFEPPCPGEPV